MPLLNRQNVWEDGPERGLQTDRGGVRNLDRNLGRNPDPHAALAGLRRDPVEFPRRRERVADFWRRKQARRADADLRQSAVPDGMDAAMAEPERTGL